MEGPFTICNSLVIVVTCLTSYAGFRSRAVDEKYIFNPEAILAGKEYHRLATSAFLHADWRHLIMNMITLYLFGGAVESTLGHSGFAVVYLGAIVGGSLLSLFSHRHHAYRSSAASAGGGWSVFTYIIPLSAAAIDAVL